MDEGDEPGSTRRKLVETKQRWAETGRLLTGRLGRRGRDRIPPGQHAVQDWPVLDLGEQPAIDLAEWRLRVDGLVERPLDWDWATFMTQPQVDDLSDMHCVTAWTRLDNHWRGVAAGHVLALAGPHPEAGFAVLHGYDGYRTNLPLGALLAPDALLAHAWEGQPLARAHGGPVRALIPGLYLWKSAKWLRRIELVAEDTPGFWERRGYHDVGDPWIEQRYNNREGGE